ncbi:GDSL-type esterase/lipase family protein [uncultured Ruminococcus sp.]|uniref:SGNH/GDSL hydrolase family protein n=1 Tax=uncultured Ruminococcus sp. TaxID=165186 RepID=UPI002635890C|nr:GDSL-type esterase/lipase family protein [uncultured Ruminococcus sp.]
MNTYLKHMIGCISLCTAAALTAVSCGSASESSSKSEQTATAVSAYFTDDTQPDTMTPVTVNSETFSMFTETTAPAAAETSSQQATAPEIITNATEPSADPNAEPTIPPYNPDEIQSGASSNEDFYKERLFVMGDSICHGFNVYGFVPHEHCLTQSSVSMWNLDYFKFNTPAGELGAVDAVAEVKPELLYMSLGMNDVNLHKPQDFADKYVDVAKQMIERDPDINIVIASITPINSNISSFTSNDNIRSYNAALESTIKAANSTRIYYFDTYSIIADPETLSMSEGRTSGDGIHLSTSCYTDFLSELYSFLDKTPVMDQIKTSEGQ